MAHEYVALVTQADIEARLSARVLAQVYDDDNDGTADTAPVARLIQDASSYVLEFYYGNYTAIPEAGSIPPALSRLALDVAHAYVAMRHPEYVRADSRIIFERVDKELTRLRKADTVTGTSPPDPPANIGGATGSIGANAPYVPPQIPLMNLGDFG